MKPVLVTGGAGFIGRHVVRALLMSGRAVRVLDADGLVPLPGTATQDAPGDAERMIGSILDADVLARASDGIGAVIHAAAIARLWTPDPADYDRVNVEGTRLVLEAALAAGADRVLHVSSYTTLMAPEAATASASPVDETAEWPPEALVAGYPRSKRRAEIAAAEAGAVIVLPSAPVGPGDTNPTPPTRLIHDLAARRLPAVIDCTLNLVDVRAVATGIVAALDRGTPGRRYLLSGEDMTMKDFLALFERLSGVPAPRLTVPLRVALAAARIEDGIARVSGREPAAPLAGVRLAALDCRFDNRRARDELGFDPPPIADALGEALAELG